MLLLMLIAAGPWPKILLGSSYPPSHEKQRFIAAIFVELKRDERLLVRPNIDPAGFQYIILVLTDNSWLHTLFQTINAS